MTEIETLVKQARIVKEQWHKVRMPIRVSKRTWQEILDNASYPTLRYGKL